MPRPTVLLLLGYFDWFSGYQEAALAAWLPRYAATEVIACDRVSPIFNDAHLARLGIPRRYATGTTIENNARVTRFRCHEKRAMVWSADVRPYIESHAYNLIIQVMPGQAMPLAGSLAQNRSVRAVLYGDNSGMWSHLNPVARLLKGAAFAVSKGMAYRYANQRADHIYGYTPETITRLQPFTPHGNPMRLLPLAFDPDRFFYGEELRLERRNALGYGPEALVVISAGRFLARKRLDLLFDAFRILHTQSTEARLLLVGADDTDYAKQIRATVERESHLRDTTTILPFVDHTELNSLFNAADIGVWPSLPAITIQQAMGTGLLPVIPNNPWVSHLVHDGMGIYFNPAAALAYQLSAAVSEAASMARSLRPQRALHNRWFSAQAITECLLDDAGLLERPLGG